MSNGKSYINSVASQVHLSLVDIEEIKGLRNNLRFFHGALRNKISLHDAAHQMVNEIDMALALKGKPRNHEPQLDLLEAKVDEIKDSLDYFVSLYACDCAEQDREENKERFRG